MMMTMITVKVKGRADEEPGTEQAPCGCKKQILWKKLESSDD